MLNKTMISRLKPKEKRYKKLDSDGLYIEVMPTGAKIWRYRYKNQDGKDTTRSLGEFPDAGIDDARKARDEIKGVGEYGINRFDRVANKFIEYKEYTGSNAKLIQARFENHIYPFIGDMPIAEIKPADILPILKRLEKKGHLELAERVRRLIGQVFKYAASNLMCESNPADLLSEAVKKHKGSHFPALTKEDEVAELLVWMRDYNEPTSVRTVTLLMQIAPYVFLRSQSIRFSRVEDVDFDSMIWTIPEENDKKGRVHYVPITEQMVPILEEALSLSDGVYLFSGRDKGKPISNAPMNKRLRNSQFKGRHVFHGFRTTFGTLARDKFGDEFEDDLFEMQLSHVEKNKVKAAYDRGHRMERRRELMRRWSEYLESLLTGRSQDQDNQL